MGNPNVGKSVVFSRITGVRVVASNYPDTTVSYSQGYMKVGDEQAVVIDVPGTYSLEPTSKAEEDILRTYNLHANCYITKPVDLNQFIGVVKSIEDFWLTVVRLPPN